MLVIASVAAGSVGAGCAQELNEDVLATVAGREVTRSEMAAYFSKRQPTSDARRRKRFDDYLQMLWVKHLVESEGCNNEKSAERIREARGFRDAALHYTRGCSLDLSEEATRRYHLDHLDEYSTEEPNWRVENRIHAALRHAARARDSARARDTSAIKVRDGAYEELASLVRTWEEERNTYYDDQRRFSVKLPPGWLRHQGEEKRFNGAMSHPYVFLAVYRDVSRNVFPAVVTIGYWQAPFGELSGEELEDALAAPMTQEDLDALGYDDDVEIQSAERWLDLESGRVGMRGIARHDGRRVSFTSSGVLAKNGAPMITLYAHTVGFDRWLSEHDEWLKGLQVYPDAAWTDVKPAGLSARGLAAGGGALALLAVSCLVVVAVRRRQ